MKRIYFACNYNRREEYRSLYKLLKQKLFDGNNIELYSFVFEYNGNTEDHKMVSANIVEMNKSDLIIAEASERYVGVGLEVGYFKAKDKKIIYLHKKGTELELCMNGIADYVINYDTTEDVIEWFDNNVSKLW